MDQVHQLTHSASGVGGNTVGYLVGNPPGKSSHSEGAARSRRTGVMPDTDATSDLGSVLQLPSMLSVLWKCLVVRVYFELVACLICFGLGIS